MEHTKETKIVDLDLLSLFICSYVMEQNCPRPLSLLMVADIFFVLKSVITYVAPNNQEEGLNLNNFTRIQPIAKVARK